VAIARRSPASSTAWSLSRLPSRQSTSATIGRGLATSAPRPGHICERRLLVGTASPFTSTIERKGPLARWRPARRRSCATTWCSKQNDPSLVAPPCNSNTFIVLQPSDRLPALAMRGAECPLARSVRCAARFGPPGCRARAQLRWAAAVLPSAVNSPAGAMCTGASGGCERGGRADGRRADQQPARWVQRCNVCDVQRCNSQHCNMQRCNMQRAACVAT
jgi:hypothetical protein